MSDVVKIEPHVRIVAECPQLGAWLQVERQGGAYDLFSCVTSGKIKIGSLESEGAVGMLIGFIEQLKQGGRP